MICGINKEKLEKAIKAVAFDYKHSGKIRKMLMEHKEAILNILLSCLENSNSNLIDCTATPLTTIGKTKTSPSSCLESEVDFCPHGVQDGCNICEDECNCLCHKELIERQPEECIHCNPIPKLKEKLVKECECEEYDEVNVGKYEVKFKCSKCGEPFNWKADSTPKLSKVSKEDMKEETEMNVPDFSDAHTKDCDCEMKTKRIKAI